MVEPEHDLGRNIEEQDENLLQVADQNSNLLHVEEDQDGDQFLDLEQEEQDDEQVEIQSISEFIPVYGVLKYTQSRVSHPKSGCPKIYLDSGNTGSPTISIAVQGVPKYIQEYGMFQKIFNVPNI